MHDLVFLVDADNTLLDNDAVRVGLEKAFLAILGPERAARLWEVYEEVRIETTQVNVPGTLERFAGEDGERGVLQRLEAALYGFPFADCVYAETPAVVRHLATMGLPVLLSDGDETYQPHKIRASGLAELVEGRVLIYLHKEENVSDIRAHYPARHYVFLDDKARILATMKDELGAKLTTVMVCQGMYANDPALRGDYPPADRTVGVIGDVLKMSREDFLPA